MDPGLCSDAMDFLPTGTTWLDITTLVIALGGLAIAVAGFGLASWRYRRESRVGVRVEFGLVPISRPGTLAVVLTNTERRTVTIERAGIVAIRDATGVVFERWHEVNLPRSRSGLPLSDPALPKTLEPGGKPYGVIAGLASVKSTFHPDVPAWAFCVDTYSPPASVADTQGVHEDEVARVARLQEPKLDRFQDRIGLE